MGTVCGGPGRGTAAVVGGSAIRDVAAAGAGVVFGDSGGGYADFFCLWTRKIRTAVAGGGEGRRMWGLRHPRRRRGACGGFGGGGCVGVVWAGADHLAGRAHRGGGGAVGAARRDASAVVAARSTAGPRAGGPDRARDREAAGLRGPEGEGQGEGRGGAFPGVGRAVRVAEAARQAAGRGG